MSPKKKHETDVTIKKYGDKTFKSNTSAQFPVVGIGASAGGLDALSAFLANVPASSGMAFVIVQHMEKNIKNILAELLQNATTMKVTEAVENLVVQPDCVYIIPPGKNMTIQNYVLHILEHNKLDDVNQPIDFFFRSLAADQRERGVGVLLSGMGVDGTLGLREIKENGGAVFIQEPSSAKFDSMPRSAVEAGIADAVADAGSLPSKIIIYLENRRNHGTGDDEQTDQLTVFYATIIDLVRGQTGHDFSLYKQNTIHRRVERRMGIYNFDDISQYVRLLEQNPRELELLFKEFLIGVTSFFRDPAEWELLKDKVIPALLAERYPADTVRVWVSGCSTGEEAYSLAIVFTEVIKQLRKDYSVQIFATDLDNNAIEKAREGIFSANIAKDMSAERLNCYFSKTEQGYQVDKSIRDMIIFAQQNMIKDPPFTKLDLLTCRNLLIYMKAEIQKKLMPLFHYSLNIGGFLFLGSAESVGSFTELFKPLDIKSRIYQRLMPLIQTEPLEFPTTFARARTQLKQPSSDAQNLKSLVDKVLLQNYSPASVLVNGKGDIIYITGRTGKYLEPPCGKVNWNIFGMAREGLISKLSEAFLKAIRQNEMITVKNIVVINDGGPFMVDISVNPLSEPEALSGMVMITFIDAVAPDAAKAAENDGQSDMGNEREEELKRELLRTRQMWQITNSEMQISQEDFKSSSEELQSHNEELQSANEELTTTKEEIQSSNEELRKLNTELQVKLNDMTVVTNDIKNLMNSTKLSILFLDNKLHVKHFTNEMTRIFRLIPGDIGRPITDIACDLIYPELQEDIKKVKNTRIIIVKQIMSSGGSQLNVRILPYITVEGNNDGVVITFLEISIK